MSWASKHTNRRRIVVLGLRHGARHVRSLLAAASPSDVVVACDTTEERLTEFRGEPRILVSRNWRDAVRDAEFVLVSLPNDMHAEAIQYVLANTFARVLCEKPLVRNLQEAKSLAELDTGRIRTIHELRLNHSVDRARRFVDVNGVATISLRWRRKSLPPSEWYRDHQRSGGGALVDLGVHLLDYCQCIRGRDFLDCIRMKESQLEQTEGISVESGMRASFETHGTLVSLDIGWLGGKDEEEVRIILTAPSGQTYSVSSRRGSHRILDDGHAKIGIRDWYGPLLSGDNLPFSQFAESRDVLVAIDAIYGYACQHTKGHPSGLWRSTQ